MDAVGEWPNVEFVNGAVIDVSRLSLYGSTIIIDAWVTLSFLLISLAWKVCKDHD